MGIADTFSRSWNITKITFRVMKQDKEIFLFPIISSILIAVFISLMLIPILISLFIKGNSAVFIHYLIIFLLYFGIITIATLFSVAVVNTSRKRFQGGNATFFESIGAALSKLHLIILWSLFSATVGILFNIIERIADKLKTGGKIILLIFKFI